MMHYYGCRLHSNNKQQRVSAEYLPSFSINTDPAAESTLLLRRESFCDENIGSFIPHYDIFPCYVMYQMWCWLLHTGLCDDVLHYLVLGGIGIALVNGD